MNNQKHHRRSIRLKGYDYSQTGAYFITICTQNRKCLFGDIFNGEMILNKVGEIVKDEWLKTEQLRPNIRCGVFCIMPNHFHGIIVIADGRGTARRAPTMEQFGKPVSNSIPTIVRSFKSAVTKQINQWHNTPGQKIWQRNYYEHIIRNEKDYSRIYEYTQNNPLKWELDSLNPANCTGTARRAPTEKNQ